MLRWLGHAAFYIESPRGVRIVTDPFGVSVPYPKVGLECDVVTVSHEHHDHNDLTGLGGKPKVFRGLDLITKKVQRLEETVEDVGFRTVPSFHDDAKGTKRGENAIFVIDVAGTKLVHLGDLGHGLDDQAVSEIGKCDILLVPVGGFYTIDGVTAIEVTSRLKPRIVVPMHYKTDHIEDWPISGPEEFLASFNKVLKAPSEGISLLQDCLPHTIEARVFEA